MNIELKNKLMDLQKSILSAMENDNFIEVDRLQREFKLLKNEIDSELIKQNASIKEQIKTDLLETLNIIDNSNIQTVTIRRDLVDNSLFNINVFMKNEIVTRGSNTSGEPRQRTTNKSTAIIEYSDGRKDTFTSLNDSIKSIIPNITKLSDRHYSTPAGNSIHASFNILHISDLAKKELFNFMQSANIVSYTLLSNDQIIATIKLDNSNNYVFNKELIPLKYT